MKTKITWFDRIMAAVTFAEANEPDMVEMFLTDAEHKSKSEQKDKEYEADFTTDLQGAELHS